ncbi:MAG: hypothetical protein R3300_00340 [Candidatus Promineifilaceae bacterium]|nr:hypothetical protein [Candidatus Promineifilaceae bacterium]
MATARVHPACPYDWWGTLPLLKSLETRMEKELDPAAYAAAQERGRQHSSAKLVLQIA